MIATITIPGKVCTDHRARVTRNGTYQPREYQAYMLAVRRYGLRSRPKGWPLDARYLVEIVVHEPDARSRDLDNASKGPLDGLKGVLWSDDRQIDELRVVRGEVRKDAACVVATCTVIDRCDQCDTRGALTSEDGQRLCAACETQRVRRV